MPAIAALTRHLVADGIAVVALDYRKILRGGRFAEAVDDVRDALAWWATNARSHGPDPAFVTLCGLSAGAALAFGAGPGTARAMIGVYGVYDFGSGPGWAGRLGPRLLFRTWDPEAWAARSPLSTFRAGVPTLLLHGEADRTVPASQSERFARQRAELGLPVRLRTWSGEPHAFLADPSRSAWSEAYAEILAFVRDPAA